jgi:hypothetical protein
MSTTTTMTTMLWPVYHQASQSPASSQVDGIVVVVAAGAVMTGEGLLWDSSMMEPLQRWYQRCQRHEEG